MYFCNDSIFPVTPQTLIFPIRKQLSLNVSIHREHLVYWCVRHPAFTDSQIGKWNFGDFN